MANVVNYDLIKGWAVTDQATDQVTVTDSGKVVTGTQVFFATEQGNTGSVFVPDQHYTKTKVHASLAHRAALVDEIGALTSESMK
jgi:hypothetical protein